ncbi:MAG: hypothetical protein H6738_08815 [Alphaproteobacteria bacterium]|nr:hypothetical protein [Alphaproteobacteria bacterium]MCB9696862.1 hypothetical protein [Alphaproteobacteria bacterium]
MASPTPSLVYVRPPEVVLVFDERWDWPAGSYDISIDGLVDEDMRATTVVCHATVGAPGLRAGDYVILPPPVGHPDGRASCDGSIRGEWAMVPEVAGGLRIKGIGDWARPGSELRVTVLDSNGAVVHQADGEPVDPVFVFISDGVPTHLRTWADDLTETYRYNMQKPPPEPGPVDEWGLPIEEEEAVPQKPKDR